MQSRGDVSINNFVKGLITEASPLTFPQGASLDEVNFALLRDGSRERRLGLDLEENYGLHDSGLSADVLNGARVQAYRWSVPNGNIDQDIGVIQLGNRIYFIDLYTQNPSANILNGGAPITTSEITNDVLMTFTTINNYLVGIANQLPQPYLFTYNPDTDIVSVETAPIQVRDLWGVDDGLGVTDRPITLSATHKYNLLNQGWLDSIVSTCGGGITAIDCTFNTFGVYPSNSDQWSVGRIEDLTSADVKKFDPEIASRNLVSTGQVARGHFIIDLYNRGASRSAQTGLTLPVDRELSRINAIAAYAGRIFYAGVLSRVVGADNRSPNLSNMVLFSQLFENKLNLVKCYQEADPTDPGINDIVDTDGGYVLIPECSYIFALKQVKQSLFVFAINGVWEIRGDEGGFRATSYQVNKVSNIGVYAPKSIVEVNGVVYFWGVSGIYMITQNDFGTWDTNSLTIPTIQKLYNAIPDGSKKNARGFYDLAQNRARWMYYSSSTKEFGEAIDIDEVPLEAVSEVGSMTSVTTTSHVRIDVVALTDTLSVVTYATGAGLFRAKVLSISGLAITPAAEYTSAFSAGSVTSVCRLSDTSALVVYLTTGNLIECRVLTVAGTTITAGAATTFACIAGSTPKVDSVSSTSAIVCYRNAAGNVAARNLTVSGTTITANAEAVISTNTTVNYQNIDVVDSTRSIVSYFDTTGNFIKVRGLLLTGTTITTPDLEVDVSAGGASIAQFTEVSMKNSSQGVITWVNAGSIIRSRLISILGTSITAIGSVYDFANNGSAFSNKYLPSSKHVLIYNNTVNNYPNMVISNISTTITEGSTTQLNNETSFEFALDILINNKIIMVYRAFSSGNIIALAANV